MLVRFSPEALFMNQLLGYLSWGRGKALNKAADKQGGRHTPWVTSCVCHAAYFSVFAFFPILVAGRRRLGLVLVIYKTVQVCVGNGST